MVAPADSARTAPVDTEVTPEGDLVLRPDPGLLAAEAQAFPLFIDPAWATGKQRWAYATGNNSNNEDLTVARVGSDPDSGKLYRSFFEFPTKPLAGKHIESAYVQMVLDHSYACDHNGSWTQMFHAGGLSGTPRTRWSTSLISLLGAATSHAHERNLGNCRDDPQPDMTVNYTQGAVRELIQRVADNRAPDITIGFCACNKQGQYESDKFRWKKFFPDKARLIVDFDSRPGVPNDLRVAKIGCNTSTVTIGTLNPDLSARFPDADSQSVTGTFEWVEVPPSGNPNLATVRHIANRTSTAANTAASTAALSITDKSKSYAFRVMGTDQAPYNQNSGWSNWCRFRIDTDVPDVRITLVTPPAGPGQPGTFRIDSSAADTVKFRYGWSDATIGEVTAQPVPGSPGKSATVVATVPNYGANIFSARAIDQTLNEGQNSLQFAVDRPSPAVARWALETYPGVDQAAALADREKGLAGDTPLAASNTTWEPDGRLVGGATATFSSSASSVMSTAGPVLDPNRSFSVAAWVRLGKAGEALPGGFRAAVTQDGDRAGSFVLGYRDTTRRWAFWMHGSDVDGAAQAGAAVSAPEATVGRWTHLAGVYDAAAARLRIYVDGQFAGEGAVSGLSPWHTNRGLVVGREKWNGGPGGSWPGAIADVQAFDRVLVGQDFTGYLPQDPASGGEPKPGMFPPLAVGSWQMDDALPCYENDTPEMCSAGDRSKWARRFRLTQGADTRRGHQGEALDLDGSHYVTEPSDPYFGLQTQEYGESQRNAAPAGSGEQWRNTPVLRTDESFTVSVWVQPERLTGTMSAVSQAGDRMSSFYLGLKPYTINGVTESRWSFASVSKDDSIGATDAHAFASGHPLTEADTGMWTHLVAVWDTGTRQMRLYVNGVRAGTAHPAAMWQGNGTLSVGSDVWSTNGGPGTRGGFWHGGIDALGAYQGAMNDAQVAALHDEQAVQE